MDDRQRQNLQMIEQTLVRWVGVPRTRARSLAALREVRDEMEELTSAKVAKRVRKKSGS